MRLSEIHIPDDNYNYKTLAQQQIGKYLPLIKERCSDIYNLYKQQQKVLYRGFEDNKVIIKKHTPTSRVPVTSTKHSHNFFNYGLSLLGINLNRDNAAFAVSDSKAAREYGDVYTFFPENGFQYTFFEIDDSIDIIDDITYVFRSWLKKCYPDIFNNLSNLSQHANYELVNNMLDPKYKDIVTEFFKYYIYNDISNPRHTLRDFKHHKFHVNEGIEGALIFKWEVMFHNTEYWGISKTASTTSGIDLLA